MVWLCLSLIAAGFIVGLPATLAARTLGRRLSALDSAGVPGQIKDAPRRVPNTGGIGIFVGLAVPLVVGLWLMSVPEMAAGVLRRAAEWLGTSAPTLVERPVLPGLVLLGGAAVLHVVGLIDDRRALGPWLKMGIMLGVAAGVVWWTDTRLLTVLDGHVGGAWLSIALTVLWIVVITNAFNFLDNMDGLSAGVAAICAGVFLAAALIGRQWYVGATLGLLVGALAAFLVFNFPWTERRREPDGASRGGASLFMGDGGSLVVGFVLAIMSVRMTYANLDGGANAGGVLGATSPAGAPAHALLTPLIVLAIPLYDFVSVVLIRLSQGRSPLVGDLQHFSHRLVKHGLTRRSAVLVIYGCTMITGIGGMLLPALEPWQAVLVGVQTVLVLLVIALYEYARGQTGPEGAP